MMIKMAKLGSVLMAYCLCFGYLFEFCVGEIRNLDCSSVIPDSRINTAYLTIYTVNVDETIVVQMVSEECYSCPLRNVTYIHASKTNCTILVDTRWRSRLDIISNNSMDFVNCSEGFLDTFFRDTGNYSIYVRSKPNMTTCSKPVLLNKVADSNIPIYVALGIFAALALLWIAFNKIRKAHCTYRLLFAALTAASCNFLEPPSYTEQDFGTPTNATVETLDKSKARKERLKSLDTFRGISLVVMMFVNYSGGGYWFFQHSKWNGLTVADLVFPWFIWIMGAAMAYSFKSMNMKSQSTLKIFWKILKRSCLLYLFGLLINSSGSENPFDFKKMRVMGVLQRFSLTYLVTATVHMLCTKPTDALQYTWWSGVRDIVNYWPEWLFNLMLVMVSLLLTFLLPVPNCPTGYLGPGGLADDAGGTFNVTLCTGGAAGFIDRTVFGQTHIYQHPTCEEIYYTNIPYEPEGLLGTITSCFMCFLGLQAGKILIIFNDFKARVRRFLIWAFVLGSIAAILCKCSQNDGWIPVNKNLWSLSFILTLSCMAFILLSFCYLTIDVYKLWSGSPFLYPGMNSIIVYMLHEFFSQPFKTFWAIHPKSHAVALTINVWDVTVWVLLSYYLYTKKIFISI